jgi:hypothetical protein
VTARQTRADAIVERACLNCGAELQGAFCSRCGQRAIPAYPTLREMAGDAWAELSGYDGRFARTFRVLLWQPGVLTREVLEGRRARYISPVRLYLVASVLYFVVAAAAPNLRTPPAPVLPGSDIKIDLANPGGGVAGLPPEQQKIVLQQLERAPWWLEPVLRSALIAPADFRRRFLATLPRALFALVPVFAAIVALFYRRRRFPQHLVFALHLHAAIFGALAVRELSNFTGSRLVAGAAELAAIAFVTVYSLRAFKRVYGDSWPWILAKSAGVAALYLVAGLTTVIATFVWAALS